MQEPSLRPPETADALEPEKNGGQGDSGGAELEEEEFDNWDEPDARFAALADIDLALDDEPEPEADDFWFDDDAEDD